MTVVIPPLKGHFSEFLVSNIFCYPLFLLSTRHPFRHILKHISLFSRENILCFCMFVGCGRGFGRFSFVMLRTDFSTSVIFSITFIYMMRNTAVFFCTRIVQTRFREPLSLLPFLNFEWSPEWESPDLMFHRTVLLLVGVFIIPHFFAIVNMANCKKCAFNFCRKSRNCNKCLISYLQTQKSVI
jgi:hypothetical protein